MKLYKNEKIFTIFIGGGTPSILSTEQLDFLFKNINNNFDLTNIKEITIEANPESLSFEKMKYLKNKINRISLGLQSFDDTILKKIGRRYTYSTFEKKLEQLRSLAFEKINIDLIIGWSFYYDRKFFFENLKIFLNKFYPEHISVYILNIVEKTKLFDLIKNGEINSIDEDIQIAEYLKMKKILENLGYEHYEISNFSFSKIKKTKNENNRCLHNLNYWKNKNYIGVGLGASSFINGIRYKNPSDFSNYFEMLDYAKKFLKKESILEFLEVNKKYLEIEVLTEREKLFEKIILNLRLLKEGIDLLKMEREIENFNKNKEKLKIFLDFEKFMIKINYFLDLGYLKYNNKSKNICLTQKGICISNFIISDLMDIEL
jgi:oxygen-independent coproporphyrinogen-3 oxidase